MGTVILTDHIANRQADIQTQHTDAMAMSLRLAPIQTDSKLVQECSVLNYIPNNLSLKTLQKQKHYVSVLRIGLQVCLWARMSDYFHRKDYQNVESKFQQDFLSSSWYFHRSFNSIYATFTEKHFFTVADLNNHTNLTFSWMSVSFTLFSMS